MNKNNNEIIEGKFSGVFFKYLITSILGMLGSALYVLGDTMIVGRLLGSDGLAALNISIPIINVYTGLGLLFGVGGATLMSIDKGKNKTEYLNSYFTKSSMLSILFGSVIMIFSFFFINEFVSFLGGNGDIFSMSKNYLSKLMLFSIPFVLNISLTVFIRNDNGPKLAMTAMLTSSILNVILDYVFIKYFNMGLTGAALATGIAPIVSIIILSIHFIRKNNTLKIELFKEESMFIYKEIFKMGFPSFIIELSSGIVIFAFNIVILKINGNFGVAAYTIIANLSLIVTAILNGISQGLQPIISINFGANNNKRVNKTLRYGIITSLVIGSIFTLITFLIPNQLISLFSSEKGEFLEFANKGLKLYFIAFIILGINLTITAYLQSIKKSTNALIVSLLRGLIFNIIFLLILSNLIGIKGVWLTLVTSELTTLIVSIISFKDLSIPIISLFKKDKIIEEVK